MRFNVQGLLLRGVRAVSRACCPSSTPVQGSAFSVHGSGLRGGGSGGGSIVCAVLPRAKSSIPVQAPGFRVHDSGLRVEGSGGWSIVCTASPAVRAGALCQKHPEPLPPEPQPSFLTRVRPIPRTERGIPLSVDPSVRQSVNQTVSQ